jgi:prophage regulatory protein
MFDRILRLPKVVEITGLSRSTIYDAMSAGTFPRAVRIGQRAVGWRETDIRSWLEALGESDGVDRRGPDGGRSKTRRR